MVTNSGNAKQPLVVAIVAPWNKKNKKKGIDNPQGLWYNIIKKRVATYRRERIDDYD